MRVQELLSASCPLSIDSATHAFRSFCGLYSFGMALTFACIVCVYTRSCGTISTNVDNGIANAVRIRLHVCCSVWRVPHGLKWRTRFRIVVVLRRSHRLVIPNHQLKRTFREYVGPTGAHGTHGGDAQPDRQPRSPKSARREESPSDGNAGSASAVEPLALC